MACIILFDLQGGIAFVAIKGVLKIYYKQQQYLRQANRVICDFDEPEQPGASTPSTPSPELWSLLTKDSVTASVKLINSIEKTILISWRNFNSFDALY